jgi:peptidoglycan/LPS O-acetylase OafA/YrhL
MSSAVGYRADIDGLRAVAVLSVLAFHVAPSVLPGGFLGVDVFFVISGYLISLILLREQADGRFRFGAFYARRVRRLFPALVAVLLATLVFGGFALFADEYERLARHAYYAIAFVLNFRLMQEAGYFDVASSAKPLLHLWSLSVEEQFYLVWPVVLLGARRLRVDAGIVIVVLGVASLAFGAHLAARSADALYYHPLARGWELLVGASVAWWHGRRGGVLPAVLEPRSARNMLSVAGSVLIAWALFTFDEHALYPGPSMIAPLLGVAALIACGRGAIVNRALAAKPLVLVGLISYPLYLWHWPLLSFVRIAESGRPPGWLLLTAALLSVLLAWGTYAWIERPIRHGWARRRVVPVLTGAMLALALASRVVIDSGGLPDRQAIRYAKDAEAQMIREPRQDSSCLALFSETDAPVYCRQSHPGERMIALVGDSHAHVLFPGVSELAAGKGYGTLLLANSGCPPFDGAVTGRNAAERTACARSIDVILSTIERDRRLVAVVLASRGPQYLDGKGFGPAEAHYNYPPIAERGPDGLATQAPPSQAFARGLQATIARLASRGLRVAYFLQVPELGIPARDCLSRPLTLTGMREGCTVAHAVYRTRMADYRSLIEGVRAAHRSLIVIDAERLFCPDDRCGGLRGTQLLYADDNHLSVAGSRLVAPLVVDALGL